jgi:tetratricopeptide (TPR) repeat protein
VLVAPLLFCALLEAGLSLAHWGYPSTATLTRQIDGRPYVCENPKFTWRFFPPRIARVGEPFSIPADKANNTYRIVVMGASAAVGVPDSAYGFARILDVILAEAYPHIQFEIVNTAITAVNSHVVAEMARDLARHQPDLFLVYLGNNEVIGPYGPGTIFASPAATLPSIRLSIRLRATRLGQLLSSVASRLTADAGAPARWTGMAMFQENQIRVSDPRMQRVYRHLRANLETIGEIAAKANARLMLCTVGSNLKDCPPFASLHRPGLSEEQRREWQDSYELGIRREGARLYDEALEAYHAAESIDDTFAELHFRMGKSRWALGDFETARDCFERAREFDTLRFRPDRRINDVIREVAAGHEGILLVDAVAAFETGSPHSCPGRELFHEHVHMNFSGSYLLAGQIFRRLTEALAERFAGVDQGTTPLSEAECADRLALTAWDRRQVTRRVLEDYVSQPPFTNQAYHDRWAESLEETMARQLAALTPDAIRRANEQYQLAIRYEPDDWNLRYKYAEFLRDALDDVDGAVEQLHQAVRLLPYSFKMHAALGAELAAAGRYQDSIEHGRRAVEIMPTYSVAHNNLGAVYVKLGRLRQAKGCFRRAVRWSPENLPSYNALIDILVHEEELDEAVAVARTALRYAPQDASMHCKLGTVLGMQGKRSEALAEIRKAAQLDPNSAEIREILESVGQR